MSGFGFEPDDPQAAAWIEAPLPLAPQDVDAAETPEIEPEAVLADLRRRLEHWQGPANEGYFALKARVNALELAPRPAAPVAAPSATTRKAKSNGQAGAATARAAPRIEPAARPEAESDLFDGQPDAAVTVRRAEPAANLTDYLAGVEAFVCRYVVFPSEHEPVAIALWTAHAHLVDQFETSPLLAVTSAEMRSGKTLVLDCLELLVPHPFRVVIPSEAVVYTVLSKRPRPTMLLDEADAIFSPRMAERYEGLRAILNAGNRQGTPVLRVKLDGRRREVEEFDVFGPKAIAGIGGLPTTVSDRAIPIRLKRRAPSEPVAKFRRRQAEAEASRLVLNRGAVTLVTDVTVPDTLNDRAADSWEPLLAIADAAGGTWSDRARLAALALSSGDEEDRSIGIRLLADVRDIFDGLNPPIDGVASVPVDHLSTAELLERLHDLEDAPWGDWYGKELTARQLARLLEPYRIRPRLRRLGGSPRRGYFRSDFADAWQRYVPAHGTVTSATPVTPTLWPTVPEMSVFDGWDDYPASATGPDDGEEAP